MTFSHKTDTITLTAHIGDTIQAGMLLTLKLIVFLIQGLVSQAPHHQLTVGVPRRYHPNSTQHVENTDSQRTSYQRHPSLSLDTRNLSTSGPSPFTPTRPTATSPVPSDVPSPLHADLTSLKSGLESLWNLSSKKLHVLHSTISAQADTLRSLSMTNANLDSTITQQQGLLSQQIDRLSVENVRLTKEARDAEEGRTKAFREREILSDANARLWEDKARLEGEKRELRVKLHAETDFARLCQLELEKAKAKERGREESQPAQRVKVKMEEDEDKRVNDANDGGAEVRVPLVHVEELIERRLQYQANECAHALFPLLTYSHQRLVVTRAAEELYVVCAVDPSVPMATHSLHLFLPRNLPSRSLA